MRWLLSFAAGVLAAHSALAFALAPPSAPAPALEAEQIVARNAVARGGVEAWRKIETMAWAGHTESGNVPGRKLPFLLEQKRPSSTRFEVITDGKRSIRGYDGTIGWKLRANSKGLPELQPYSDEELRFARGAQVIEGPLMDYAAKGAVITVGGTGELEGRRAYILDVKLPSGGNHRVWVDAETFLELRHDRQVRGVSGRQAQVSVFFRDYHDFDGLKIPVVIETAEAAGAVTNRLVIEKVALNPALDVRMFAQPSVPTVRHHGVTVDTRGAAPAIASHPSPQP